MKRLKLLILAMFMAVTIGLPAKSVFAASVSLAQSDFDEADCTTQTATSKGITCDESEYIYTLPAGDYVLSGDVAIPDDYILVLGEDGDYTLDLGGYKLSGNTDDAILTVENTGKTVAISNGTITNANDGEGVVGIYGVTATLSGLTITSSSGYALNVIAPSLGTVDLTADVTLENNTITGAVVSGDNATVTINSGTYTGHINSPAAFTDFNGGGNLVINGGTFTGVGGASAVYAFGDDGANGSVTITGGIFRSDDAGLNIEGAKDVTVSGGLFEGGYAGLLIGDYKNVTLSGGTYKATDNLGDGSGAIVIMGADNVAALQGILASGYTYTDGNAAVYTGLGASAVYLTNKNVSVVPAGETVAAPDSGRNTKTAGDTATVSLATGAALATVLAASTLALTKKAAKRSK